ncbi:DUF2909 domain-containing protein [Ferrimonas aestuarii]|uniref:DUF2909 domain-containing protein n=1 Tax=Ferrimonas aestuarii TaxID=2569539 RepID=A0A4U1BQ37_9GAMM|nr:DUF2909 domain-containing protein [Ferrimonas aestuarii]TKB56254.1 DUF2909 domain-containing protein [Ferrimonas aestuarii]
MPLLFKLVIVGLLLVIIFNLGRALVMMLKEGDNARPMSHYLGRRVGLSAMIIILLLIAMAAGWITPNPRPY